MHLQVCDRNCKNAACGFDGGDCGPELMVPELIGYAPTTNASDILVAHDTPSIYLNLSGIFGGRITEVRDRVCAALLVGFHVLFCISCALFVLNSGFTRQFRSRALGHRYAKVQAPDARLLL